MKLAEALSHRSDLQKRLAQLSHRISSSAKYQEGELAPEDANALLNEAREVIGAIEKLVRAINRTNSVSELEPGFTITDAIARRDALGLQRKVITEAAASAGSSGGGYGRLTRSELKWVTDLSVAALRREADQLAKDFRILDLKIQQANWEIELVF